MMTDNKCIYCREELDEGAIDFIEDIIEFNEDVDKINIDKYKVCSECIDEIMSCYGYGDEICMSGADDMWVSKRIAHLFFGM